MPYYSPPDYVDNTGDKTLAATLNRIIQETEQREMDVATGYFDPAVWQVLRESLPLLEQFRLLLGQAPEIEAPGDGSLDLADYYRQQVREEVEALPYTRE